MPPIKRKTGIERHTAAHPQRQYVEHLGKVPFHFVCPAFDTGTKHPSISSYETTAQLNGNGEYTVSVDLSKGYTADGWDDEDTGDMLELTSGNGIAVLGVQIYGEYPELGVDIKSVKFDGTEVALKGASYTNNEDGGRRTNIYNEWASFDAAEHATKNADSATPTLIDNSSIGEWTKIEVTFEVYGLEDSAPAANDGEDDNTPAATEAPAAGTGNTSTTTTDKNNADTGVEGVAVVAGLAIVAAGAVVVAKKRK